MTSAGNAEQGERGLPAHGEQQSAADERHEHRPDVAAGDVGADREAAPLGRVDVGQQGVADRVLRAGADAGDADRGQQLADRLRQAAEQQPVRTRAARRPAGSGARR